MNSHVKEVIAASERILICLGGCSYEDFVRDSLRAEAALKYVEGIRNSAMAILDEGSGSYASVDWEGLAAAADFLARGREAFGIDYEILWYFTRTQLPPMIDTVKALQEPSR